VSEPILIRYDDSPDAVRPIGAAAALLGSRPAVVVDGLPWMTAAQSVAATSSLAPGTTFEELNEAEARGIAVRNRPSARSRRRGVIVIGSRGLTGMKKIFDASVRSRSPSTPAGPC
jgi:hypothetical protein